MYKAWWLLHTRGHCYAEHSQVKWQDYVTDGLGRKTMGYGLVVPVPPTTPGGPGYESAGNGCMPSCAGAIIRSAGNLGGH